MMAAWASARARCAATVGTEESHKRFRSVPIQGTGYGVASNLPAQELTTFSYKILWYEIVVTNFADAEFKVATGDYIFIHRVEVEIEAQVSQYEEAIQLLLTLPASGRISATMILGEIGTDMSRFPTAKHLASWAGVCPGNRQNAGKRLDRSNDPGQCLSQNRSVRFGREHRPAIPGPRCTPCITVWLGGEASRGPA